MKLVRVNLNLCCLQEVTDPPWARFSCIKGEQLNSSHFLVLLNPTSLIPTLRGGSHQTKMGH